MSMIRTSVFDLDGTLVETEELKALSYARAAVELRPDLVEAEVVEAFKDFVGRSRQEVATGLVRRFGLEEEARSRIFGSPRAGTPLMVSSPLLALDLPLKILVCRNRDGEVLVSYNATSYLARLSRRWSYLPHERWSHSQERIDAGGAREAGVW